MPKIVVEINQAEMATILAALRHFQETTSDTKADGVMLGRALSYGEHFQDFDPLDDEQIDALCERINCAPESPIDPTLGNI